jgi:hypothetical protein
MATLRLLKGRARDLFETGPEDAPSQRVTEESASARVEEDTRRLVLEGLSIERTTRLVLRTVVWIRVPTERGRLN